MRIYAPLVLLMFAVLAPGCGNEQDQGSEQRKSSPETTTATTAPGATTTETTGSETTAETTVAERQSEEAPNSSPQERPPEDVLALQYEYINRGDYQNAYSLFAEQSQQEVSLGQYQAFFEANAPYSLSDYSFSSQAQGDSATVDASFTVNSASGVEQLQKTQRLVRENREWRVVMRPDQVAAFTAASSPTSSAPVEEEADQAEGQADEPPQAKAKSPASKQAPRAERGAPASEIIVRISGTVGVPYEGDISASSEARNGQQPIEGVVGQGQNEYRILDIVGDVQVSNVLAGARKSRPGIEGDLRVEILYQGAVEANKVATGTAGSAVTSWSPGLP